MWNINYEGIHLTVTGTYHKGQSILDLPVNVESYVCIEDVFCNNVSIIKQIDQSALDNLECIILSEIEDIEDI